MLCGSSRIWRRTRRAKALSPWLNSKAQLPTWPNGVCPGCPVPPWLTRLQACSYLLTRLHPSVPEWMKLDSHCPERSRFLQAKSTPERFCFLPFIPFGRSRIPKSGRLRPPLLGFGSPRGGDDGTIDAVDDRVLGKAPRRALPPAERPELRRGDGGVHPVALGTRAGGQRGEVPEEGLGLEHTPGKGCVHRCPERAITDTGVGGHGARSGAEGEDGKNTTQRERIGSRKPRGRRGWEELRRGGSRSHGWKGAEGA
uniref:Uncharacterized protein n=1 Tax=Zea mays TaxID=4577 RepID=C4JAB3_MAIZE|nr:unknown [Zea mays]